jgi:hypothetical protein
MRRLTNLRQYPDICQGLRKSTKNLSKESRYHNLDGYRPPSEHVRRLTHEDENNEVIHNL